MSEHPTLDGALKAIRELFEAQGERAVDEITLFKVDHRGGATRLGAGAQLLTLIEAQAQKP